MAVEPGKSYNIYYSPCLILKIKMNTMSSATILKGILEIVADDIVFFYFSEKMRFGLSCND